MSENNKRRFYRGSARWAIIGIVAALAVIFVIVVAFGSTLLPSGPKTGGMQWEVKKMLLLAATPPIQALSKSQMLASLLAERQPLRTYPYRDNRVV
jgi:hypothetical protein